MKNILPVLIVIMATLFIPACQKDKIDLTYYFYENDDLSILNKYLSIPAIPFQYNRIQFSSSDPNEFHSNQSSLGTLGRTLFYDKNLSADGKISCASCHLQTRAFSDTSALSTGIHGRKTFRNSLALGSVKSFSASYGGSSGNFFWDDRAFDLREQCIETFNNPNEMGITLKQVVQKTKNTEYYPILAKYLDTKGSTLYDLDTMDVLRALSTFMDAMVSDQTKFDKGLGLHGSNPSVNFSNFTAQENMGKAIFNEKCSQCHGKDFSRSSKARANNGLSPKATDTGRYRISGIDSDKNVFKVPVLRNIALTAPYTHDGRFQTLEEVIDHYSEGIDYQENLDPSLVETVFGMQRAKQFKFSSEEKSALLAFLHTLTDEKLISDPRFSNPFK
jgi:cytochrome c peroxidase